MPRYVVTVEFYTKEPLESAQLTELEDCFQMAVADADDTLSFDLLGACVDVERND